MGKLIIGVNDLAIVHTELLKEWDYEKNDKLGIFPDKVTCGSGKKVWWKCSKGHEWQAIINNRTRLCVGCPECSSDSRTSFPEQAIYYFLNMVFSDEVKNRYKLKDEKGFIEIDIYLNNKKIAIEYDGLFWHKNKQEKDLEKEFRVKTLGIKFIRIVEHNVNKIIDNCILYNCHKNRDRNLTWAIKELFIMLGINDSFVNVSVFRSEILEFSHTNEVKNSLAVVNPELAKEWHPTKNGILKPTMFTCGSGEKVWWKCKYGHEWQAIIGKRNDGHGCLVCSGRKLVVGVNDLQTVNLELAKEWNYDKNGSLLPSKISFSSSKKVWWRCNKCGYEWQAEVGYRNSTGSGCRKCASLQSAKFRQILKLVNGNSLENRFPELIKEWNYEKNIDIIPSQLTPFTHKKVWWKCQKCGYAWQASVANRTNLGRGCPECAKARRRKKQ